MCDVFKSLLVIVSLFWGSEPGKNQCMVSCMSHSTDFCVFRPNHICQLTHASSIRVHGVQAHSVESQADGSMPNDFLHLCAVSTTLHSDDVWTME